MFIAPRKLPVSFCMPGLFALSMLATTVVSCGEPAVGHGLGLPTFAGRISSKPMGITLSRLLPPSAMGPQHAFVELINNSNGPIDTKKTKLWLQSSANSVLLPATLWAEGEALTLTGDALGPLNLHGTAGELAVMGAALNLEAYAAWGADPSTLPGGLSLLAASLGFGIGWQPLPYPLSPNVAINLDLTTQQSACVTPDLSAVPPFAAIDCAADSVPAALYISRIQPSGVDANGPAMELYNAGTEPLDLAFVQLCARGVCQPIVPLNQNTRSSAHTWLAAGDAHLPWGAKDVARRRIVMAGGGALSDLDIVTAQKGAASTDEVALVAPGRDISEPGAVLAYARFSTAPKTAPGPTTLLAKISQPAAVAPWAGVTLQAPLLAKETLALKVRAAGAPWDANAWTLDGTAFGTVLADDNAPYRACSAPKIAAPRPALVVAQVTTLDAGGVVFLLNSTDAPVQLADYTLAQGENIAMPLGHAALASGMPMDELPAGALLRVALSPEMNCLEPFNICWSDPGVSLDAGELSVLRRGVVIAHLQWGTSSLASELGDAAAAAGAWPMAACRVAAFTGEQDQPASLVLLPGRPGTAPPDYALGAQAVGSDIYVANP